MYVKVQVYKDVGTCAAVCQTGKCVGSVDCLPCQGAECLTAKVIAAGGMSCSIVGPFTCRQVMTLTCSLRYVTSLPQDHIDDQLL
jgi:hypothetical protein